ncbi:capsid cement protein [Arenimonas sp.]|uniref:capsid cement protein n=1 Tax=Arenimonas sp. TaxID=1872635 RepID=UPI0025BAE11B|nr:capsid cement protein [Arenimonas sp.]
MSNQLLTKAFLAGGAIPAGSLVKFGADDNTVVVSAAAADAHIGVVESFDVASGERCDVVMAGIAEVKIGGGITRGGPVTSNASGQGVAAAPAAGTNNGVIGRALASGVSGDVIPVLVVPGTFQG